MDVLLPLMVFVLTARFQVKLVDLKIDSRVMWSTLSHPSDSWHFQAIGVRIIKQITSSYPFTTKQTNSFWLVLSGFSRQKNDFPQWSRFNGAIGKCVYIKRRLIIITRCNINKCKIYDRLFVCWSVPKRFHYWSRCDNALNNRKQPWLVLSQRFPSGLIYVRQYHFYQYFKSSKLRLWLVKLKAVIFDQSQTSNIPLTYPPVLQIVTER